MVCIFAALIVEECGKTQSSQHDWSFVLLPGGQRLILWLLVARVKYEDQNASIRSTVCTCNFEKKNQHAMLNKTNSGGRIC